MFVPLRVKSHYSLGYGTASIPELIQGALRLGVPGLALTDRDNLYGQVEFHHACRAAGLRPITGVERGPHVLLARNRTGYENLCRILSHDAPLREHADGLFILSRDPAALQGLPNARLLVAPGSTEGVADSDVVMASPHDHLLHALQRAIRGASDVAPPERSFADLRRLFPPAPLNETLRIAEACDFDLLSAPPAFPDVEDADGRLARRAREGLGPREERYRDRLERELDIIRRLGFSGYFLAVAEVVDDARRRGIGVAGRGSACASLAAYALGMTDVDPIAHGLYFERFLHARKAEWSDIDIDLASDRREELIEAAIRRHGESRAARVGVINRFQRAGAYLEGRKAGFPDAVIERLIGKPRHLSVHPGGLVLASGPIDRRVPLEIAPKGVPVTQYDLRSLPAVGLIKIDLLGNRCLAEIDEAARRLGRHPEAPDGDAATLRTISAARTIGCFQIESPAMRFVLARAPMGGVDDLMRALAIVRPGPASGRAKEAFLRGEPGVLLYEEDIITMLVRDMRLPADEADELRTRLNRGDIQPEEFYRRGGSQALWESIAPFASYAFNKAHAASYARLAWRSAHLKTHHPVEFACAVLNHYGGMYPLRTVAADFQRAGVRLLGPCVQRSEPGATVEDGAVRVGLSRIKHLSRKTVARILAGRPFRDVEDLLRRAKPSDVEREALELSGALDGLRPPPAVHPLRRVQNELRFLDMHLSAHPMALLRGEAAKAGCVELARAAGRVRVAGLVAAARRVSPRAQFVTFEDETGLLESLVPRGLHVDDAGPWLAEGAVRDARLRVSALRPFHERRSALT